MVKPKVSAGDLPKLVRRMERTTLYISEKSSAIAYNTGIFYLRRVADALTNQKFHTVFKPLAWSTIIRKEKDNHPTDFWIDSGDLYEELMIAKPQVFKNSHNKKSYVIRFSPETSKKIFRNEVEGISRNTEDGGAELVKRPVFKPYFDEMKAYMLQEGRKALMEVVKGDRPYRSKARIGWM